MFYDDGWVQIHNGDCLEVLRGLPPESVHCVCTSPPYYGLRDYGTGRWEGGKPDCKHTISGWNDNMKPHVDRVERDGERRKRCLRCGAIRIDKQIGLEQSPEEYIAKLVEIFREVKRVLHPSGTLWIVIGDSYVGGKGQSGTRGSNYQDGRRERGESINHGYQTLGGAKETRPTDDLKMLLSSGLKPKDLIGIPYMLAFALRADGWYWRDKITWAKGVSFCDSYSGSCMPESVEDRCTKASEEILMFSKSKTYFADMEDVKERAVYPAGTMAAKGSVERYGEDGVNARPPEYAVYTGSRNLRNVWAISPKGYIGAHFAVYPLALVEPIVKIGTSEKGCCAKCGTPMRRIVKRQISHSGQSSGYTVDSGRMDGGGKRHGSFVDAHSDTIGWQSGCSHDLETKPCVVLDPFGGSGTTAEVAKKLGRKSVLIELNADYCKLAVKRVNKISIPMHF